MDLRKYIFTKVSGASTLFIIKLTLVGYNELQEVKQHIIAMSDDVNKIKDLIAKLMEVCIKYVCIMHEAQFAIKTGHS